MATKVTYLVFIMPVVLSLVFGGAVLAQSLQDPGKGFVFEASKLEILGLKSQYSASEPVAVEVAVSDHTFDCGDLYITIHNLGTGEVITQGGFFEQCFAGTGAALPIDDEFSELVGEPGRYEIEVEISDKSQKDSASAKAKFTVG